MSSTKPTETLYVALLNHGADAWRPVVAARRGDGVFEILSRNDDPEDEVWEFSTGSLVRCESRQLPEGTRLVAVERVAPRAPRVVK